MKTCCRSRRTLLVLLAAISLVSYYLGSTLLWAGAKDDKRTSHIDDINSDYTGQQSDTDLSSVNEKQEPVFDVKCTGEKCGKYMQLLGLAKSGGLRQKTVQYCKYPQRDPNVKRQSSLVRGPPLCGSPAILEQRLSMKEDILSILKPTKDEAPLRCQLDAIRRGDDDNRVTYEIAAVLSSGGTESATLKGSDFHRIRCNNELKAMEEDNVLYIAHVDRKEETVKDAKDATCKHCTGYNVLILGIDALSQSNFERYLPRTMEYLTKTMEAVVMRGYNAVGPSNSGTLIPMLTGQHESELPEARRGKTDSHYTDEFDLIWKEYEVKGYVTLFAEDEPERSTFNAYYHGFEMEPTNHYMRPFWLAVARGSSKLPASSSLKNKYCLGAKMKHQLAFSYLSGFFDKYHDMPRLAIMHHNSLSSDDVSHVQHMDEELAGLLQSLSKRGHLDKTVVIVMSDHGAMDGKSSTGAAERLEARSPMLVIGLPPTFRKERAEYALALSANAERLTTPFDVHVTLRDLLDERRLGTRSGGNQVSVLPRGASLFAEVPISRTCQTAGVDPHWCTCATHRQLDPNSDRSRAAAQTIVKWINSLTERHRERCVPLGVRSILDSQWLVLNDQALEYTKTAGKESDGRSEFDKNYLQVAVVTSPSSIVYEATVVYDALQKSYKLTEAGAIRVSSATEASSHCLDDFVAMQYCDCR